MTGKRLFLKWVLFLSLIIVGAVIAANLGWVGYLKDDPTHITYVTLGVFVLATLMCGRLCWRLCGAHDKTRIELGVERAWFAGNICMYIGLIGTAVGYVMMLKHSGDASDPEKVIQMGFANAAIALINTVVGAVTGVLLQLQAHYIESASKIVAPSPEAAPTEPKAAAPMPPAAEPVMLVAPAEDAKPEGGAS